MLADNILDGVDSLFPLPRRTIMLPWPQAATQEFQTYSTSGASDEMRMLEYSSETILHSFNGIVLA